MSRQTDLLYSFASDPTANDDSGDGYQVGDEWVNTSTDEIFECFDNTSTAAIWISKNSIVLNGASVIGAAAILDAPTISSSQNDYDPTGFRSSGVVQISFLILNPDGNYNLTGLAAPSPAVRNRVVLFNNGSGTMTLVNGSASSSAANRFSLKNNITIQQQESVEIIYSTTISRWVAITI